MPLSLRIFRIDGGSFVVFLIALFIIVGLATFAYLESTGELSDYKINLFSSIGSDDLSSFEEDIDVSQYEENLSIGAVSNGQNEQEEGLIGDKLIGQVEGEKDLIIAPKLEGSIEKFAEKGDSVTTLARKALKDYLAEADGLNLTREHKLFIEDYIQNRISDKELQIGEKLSISRDLIAEAVEKSEELSDAELEELQNYSELVWNPKIE